MEAFCLLENEGKFILGPHLGGLTKQTYHFCFTQCDLVFNLQLPVFTFVYKGKGKKYDLFIFNRGETSLHSREITSL